MWGMFALALVASLAALLLPGMFVARGLRFSWLESAICAPLASIALYSIEVTAYSKAGIPCVWASFLLPAFAAGLALWLVSRRRSKARGESSCGTPASTGGADDVGGEGGSSAPLLARLSTGAPCAALYVAVGLVAMCAMYVANAGDALCLVTYYDNLHHVDLIKSFLVSGDWSSFGQGAYPEGYGVNPTGQLMGFYPSAWHAIAAFAASLTGANVATAENASVMAFAAVVLPAGMFLLVRRLFPEKPAAVFFGAFATMAFAFLPWRLTTWGPIFPNLAALALTPAAAFLFIELLGRGVPRRRRAACAALFCMGMLALGLTQPNAVFTLGVFVAPLIVARVACAADGTRASARSPLARWALRLVLGAVAVCAIAAAWYACFRLPALQGVVTYSERIAYDGVRRAVLDVVKVRFLYHPDQPVLSLAIAVGALWCVVRRPRNAWIVASYVLISVCYVASVATEGFPRYLLSGFWYTDFNRLAACVCLFAVPFVAVAFAVAGDALVWLARKARSLGARLRAGAAARAAGAGERARAAGRTVAARPCPCAGFVVSCVLAAALFPAIWLSTWSLSGYEENVFDVESVFMRDAFQNAEGGKLGGYTVEERAFVDEALAVVPEGVGIANIPHDGSAFAYPVQGARVLYRTYEVEGPDELPASVTLRTRLSEAASSQEVRDAARQLGVEYVLLLDADPADRSGIYELGYVGEQWTGLLSVAEDTPGFELLLSRGDMRLYRISALDEA